MKINKGKLILIIVVIFVLVYLSGFGSLIGDEFIGDAVEGNYVTAINYVSESQAIADDTVLMNMCNIFATSSFRFPSGLTGEIKYFYGGKADSISAETGLDANFGKWMLETDADGSDGAPIEYKPYGLDCSGFVTYMMWLSGVKDYVDGGMNMYELGEFITLDTVQSGDLVFKDNGTSPSSHVGIVKVNDDGTIQVYHCNAADNGIVLSGIVTAVGVDEYWTEIKSNPYVD